METKLPNLISCPLCHKIFEDNPLECLVGGHWTPHSSRDNPPYGVKCCHKYQKEITNFEGLELCSNL